MTLVDAWPIQVITVTPPVIEELAKLDERCFGGEAMSVEEWAKALQYNAIVVGAFKQNGEVVGLAVAKHAAGTGYLYSSAVSEEARGQGLGTQMTEMRKDLLKKKGCTIVQAHTRTENVASQAMLAKCGLKPKQYVPDFYDDCEDAILWEGEL